MAELSIHGGREVFLSAGWSRKEKAMAKVESGKRKGIASKRTFGLSKKRLAELVEEATVDAHDGSEQATGFYTMIENDLRLPFTTEILGVPVIVESIDFAGDDQLVAVCRKGTHRQRISLLDLPIPSPPPEGAEWIAAYCHWRSGWM
jgi:hypothetical protein